jgi:hypothetical protein
MGSKMFYKNEMESDNEIEVEIENHINSHKGT